MSSRRHFSNQCGQWSVSYSTTYITVTCLVVYIDLRLILFKSFSVAVHLCSVLFGFVFLKVLLWSLWWQKCFMHGSRPVAFFMVIPIDNVSKCLWPCSLYGKDIIHSCKTNQQNIYCILVYLYNYVLEKIATKT